MEFTYAAETMRAVERQVAAVGIQRAFVRSAAKFSVASVMDEVVQPFRSAHSQKHSHTTHGAKASGTAPGACLGLAISVGNRAATFI